jgi:glycosyltransferase involved in cell wall biosynthesis
MKTVSIIIPCRNEEDTICSVLQAVYGQQYQRDLLEVIIADGLSTDNTLEKIEQFKQDHTDLTIRVISNQKTQIPAALNLAIKSAKNEVILRMDAHSIPREDYIALCVRDLEAGKGDNVGGRWEIIPRIDSWMARGISRAAAHPLGAGNARYRTSGEEGPVDTVPFGCYQRVLFERIGLFDETLLTNEDYELNERIRRSGGVVWFDPEIVCRYYSQPTLKGLTQQYWRYGFWKARMARKYPASLKLRQLMPPLFVIGLLFLLFLSLFQPIFLTGFVSVFLLYLSIIIGASFPVAIRQNEFALICSVPLAILTMHVTWGAGFMAGLLINR